MLGRPMLVLLLRLLLLLPLCRYSKSCCSLLKLGQVLCWLEPC